MTQRDAAWAAVHDPATDAATLAQIAQLYPEFADAIAVHPNCYDGLRQWLATLPEASAAPEVVASTAQPVHTRAGPPRWAIIGGAVAAGVVLLGGGAVWGGIALTAQSSTDGTPSASGEASEAVDTERTLAGPPVYIGDELDWLMLDDAQLAGFFPEATTITHSELLGTVGESEGVFAEPEACGPWLRFDVSAIVGVRSAVWQTPDVADYASGRFVVRQFPNVDLAVQHFATYADSLDACSTYDVVQYGEDALERHTLNPMSVSDTILLVDDTVTESVYEAANSTRLLALEGNVVVAIDAPYATAGVDDPDALVQAVTERLAEARATLTEQIGYR